MTKKEKSIFDRWREQEIIIIHKSDKGERQVEISCDQNGKAVVRNLDNIMHIGNYVYVTNPDKELYRRRCKIIKIDEEGAQTKYLILSEGLEEEEWILEEDAEPSKY